MNLNFRKTALLAGICSVFSLGYAPQLFAVSSTDTVEAVQQTKKITGVVSDAMGPIIGANVLEKGTTNGVITDIDGNFALNVKPGATIVVSFIGYVSQEIKITSQTTVNITLKEDSEMLDEVVVVGYGTMKKSDLSGASVSMSEDKIKGSIITNLDQSLQGRAAGVTAVSTSGAPGSSSSIRVRGQATINANAEPLYVIDGVIVQSQGQSGSSYGLGDALGNGSVSTISPLSTINPADIVSMEILKDASATAIYGAQGSNGVVLITTKRGKAGEAKFMLDRQKLTGNIFFEVTPIKNLVWHAELGYDISSSKGERYKPMVDLGGWVRSSNESNIQKNSSTFWQLKNYVTYSGNIGDKHHYTAMVGQECWESSYDFTSVFNSGLPSDEVHNPALGTGTPTINAGFGSSSMASFFTRLTYNYADRYLGTYTYRYDGSSNFGPENRWAGFHSLATSWRFSNETFFEPLKKVISNGKLRLGWGQTGNANIGGYAWGTSMSRMPSGLGMGYRPSNIPNTSIKWESQEQWNVGVDLGFLHDRINLTVEWYKKTSSDMLMPLQLPSYMGTSGNASSALAAPKGNYGDIENTGFEISLNTHPITGKFEWDSDFQISFNKNKLKGLAGTANAQIVGYGQWTDVVSVSSVGESLYNFYGFVCDGVYKDLEDLQTSPKPAKYPANGVFDRTNTVWVGDVKYKDISGPDDVPDGVIDDYDKTNIGSPMPKFTFGWTNTFRYKNFDLSVFINGSYGNKVYNYLSMKLTHMNSPWTNQLNAVNGRAQLVPINPNKVYEDGTMWYNDVSNVMVANPGASIPRATINDPNDNDRISDRYIEDGSYIRLKNISLGYTFPKKTIDKLGLSNLRIYANIQNLLTITGYDGYDPEIGASTSSVNVYGLDNGRYPSPTVYSFGLNVSF